MKTLTQTELNGTISTRKMRYFFFIYIETASIKNRTFHNVAAVFFSLQNKEDNIKGTDNNIMRLDLREYRSNSFFFPLLNRMVLFNPAYNKL